MRIIATITKGMFTHLVVAAVRKMTYIIRTIALFIPRYCRPYIVPPLMAALLLVGCSPTAIRPNAELDMNASLLGGFVVANPQKQGPIILTAYGINNGKTQIAGHARLQQSGAFYLPVPPGMYYLAAFLD